MKNLKLTNKYREDGGAWFNADAKTIAYAQKILVECRETEPTNDWHLETRGESADWHRMNADRICRQGD